MTKAKRRLKNFNFEADGSHVALVGKHQGGPANGYTTLITKSTEGIPQAFVEKADMVRVTMTIQEFLRRFFGLYYEDAEILARILGYDTEMEDNDVTSYEEYIQSKIDSVEIMKSLFKAEDMTKALSEVTEEQFDKLLQDQLMIEKAMSSEGEPQEGVSKQNVNKTKEDVTPMDENKDMIQKSEVESLIEKAVSELKTDLQKANETIETYKAKEAERVAETRKALLKDAVKDEEKAEKLFKSFEGMSDESFAEAVDTLKAMSAAADAGEMFTEKGADAEQEEPAAKHSATMELLRKQYA
ncbi:MAG: hypothetical protein GOVbin1096_78 [Prokaryotic dsDNA virus sp.]|jgi:hypothetical protein|nr:MAG: hypothetical protein GOVbin1096_78 [Prokaryotic dsDNA virus sp.]|tara:strand:- start:7027 stop:7923 length:897 start_codon:yes stop_codon:yes gene_type:complete